LAVLRERYPKGLPAPDFKPKLVPSSYDAPLPVEPSEEPNYIPIPDSIVDVGLAVQKDIYDPEKGWRELQLTGAEDSPKSMAMKDGAAVAFKFRGEKLDKETNFEVQWSKYADEE
jgi:hypothetical protein